MLNPTATGRDTRAQIADTDEAILRFAVTTRQPDRDVHPSDLAWWLAREERLRDPRRARRQRAALDPQAAAEPRAVRRAGPRAHLAPRRRRAAPIRAARARSEPAQ